MAIIFLLIGISLALLGVRDRFRKNIFTYVTVGVGLVIFLLFAGVDVPGELLLIGMPVWAVSLMRAKPIKKLKGKGAK